MKRSVVLFSLTLLCLSVVPSAFGQRDCEFNIIGTWKAVTTADVVLYRFTADGRVRVLSASSGPLSEAQEIGSATYELDNPRSPKSLALTVTSKNRVFLYGKSSMKVLTYADSSLTCEMPGWGPTRWVKLDPHRYFIVLAARNGEFYDTSGPAFPILIKMDGPESVVDAVGTYSDHGKAAFGTVPPEAYKDFMRESQGDSEVMLRLEINSAQYERGLKVLRTWERRVREDTLLYPSVSRLNNVLLVKAVTETLNQCGEEIKLYKLNYIHPEDWLSDQYAPAFIPFAYFRELRRLNESLHVRDDKFQQASTVGSQPGN
ncbi:MAG: hypothetical protein ND895_23895 [Pyrinomonadaceae bacterium]|nr:hypothetical protein [Pyrinomonadaceae bacterium]